MCDYKYLATTNDNSALFAIIKHLHELKSITTNGWNLQLRKKQIFNREDSLIRIKTTTCNYEAMYYLNPDEVVFTINNYAFVVFADDINFVFEIINHFLRLPDFMHLNQPIANLDRIMFIPLRNLTLSSGQPYSNYVLKHILDYKIIIDEFIILQHFSSNCKLHHELVFDKSLKLLDVKSYS